MTCEGFLLQPGGCSPVKLLGFTCFHKKLLYKKVEAEIREKLRNF